jgi:predicted GIY-YIG superfamily endonuclease
LNYARASPPAIIGPEQSRILAHPVHAIYGDHRMATFHYVYILISESQPEKHYTGLTVDLGGRLKRHNSGHLPSTAKYKPWLVDTAIAFRSRQKALAFEKYLKSHSGRAFAKKHF